MSDIVAVIRSKIKERGITMVFISRQLGMNPDLLSKTMNGSRNLKADEFVNLCQLLDLTLEDFKTAQ